MCQPVLVSRERGRVSKSLHQKQNCFLRGLVQAERQGRRKRGRASLEGKGGGGSKRGRRRGRGVRPHPSGERKEEGPLSLRRGAWGCWWPQSRTRTQTKRLCAALKRRGGGQRAAAARTNCGQRCLPFARLTRPAERRDDDIRRPEKNEQLHTRGGGEGEAEATFFS